MKKNNLFLLAIMLIGAIFLQVFAFCNMPQIYYENGFAIGILNSTDRSSVGINMIYVVLPIIFILFLTSGAVSSITTGYGKLLIIRNYSKTKLLLKQCIKNTIMLAIIVLFQLCAFLYFNRFLKPVEKGMAQAILMYFIILNAIVLLQCLLEHYMPAHNVNIFLFIYCFASYYITQVFTENPIIKIILFPCLLYGMQNGATSNNDIFYVYLVMGVIINALLLVLCIRKFKKIDIF